jgi:SAM-dependent methyltransferase
MNSFWNERYGQRDFVYGETPNVFFAETLGTLKQGAIILPCDGEGRNAVHAAREGWEVNAFDLSDAGMAKANHLALKYGVAINFQLKDAATAIYFSESVDVVALIYAHLPPLVRKKLHRNVIKWLKPGGKIILEAFCPDQLNNQSGGPKDIEMLYTKEMLEDDFHGMSIEVLAYQLIQLKEGKFHEGPADVIRMIATKL